ncbi:hypothetical protein RvY_04851 [Ramazzottius varieornatus]|uniref:Uncharacterized protein n=1 Tax=Ramazzottius varieornatus TaxID=947166 RepID=A0A1D1V2Y0_RAMVA|nr:hypothetical protein RvY_04851 [Ramazzottius varieornatus]
MPSSGDKGGSGDQEIQPSDELAHVAVDAHDAWSYPRISAYSMKSHSFYDRLQLSMDDLSYSDWGGLIALIASSWAICGLIVYITMFFPHM